jgi:putative NADPH-quinone reductase
MNSPAILKGWFERVFTPGFAYGLTPEGWRGADVSTPEMRRAWPDEACRPGKDSGDS